MFFSSLLEKDAKEFDGKLANSGIKRLFERSWEIILNIVLRTLPYDPDAEAHLAQDLQLVDYRERQRSQAELEESNRKFREEMYGNIRKSAAAKRKSIKEKLKELRFDYAAARQYSLKPAP